MAADCYTTNCDRDCTVSNTITAVDIENSKWCDCTYYDVSVIY